MFLVYALWAVALLSTIALSLLATGNTSYHLSHNALTTTHNDAAADAAVARAVLALLDSRPERRWRVDGTPHEFVFGSLRMQIAIQDELGRIDLNHADQSLLTGLLQSAGLKSADASALVDKILDWRDPLPGKRVNGAQERDYRTSGFAYNPRGGPFQSVDELKLVMGITSDLYQRVQPALTVYSGRQFFDPQFAPRESLAALTGMNSDAAVPVLAARARQGSRAGVIDPAVPLRGRAFSIKIQSPKGEGALLREVVVRLTDNVAQPYWILSWRFR